MFAAEGRHLCRCRNWSGENTQCGATCHGAGFVCVSCAFCVRFACVRVMRACLECACVVEMSVKGFRSICPSCFSCEWHGLIRVL